MPQGLPGAGGAFDRQQGVEWPVQVWDQAVAHGDTEEGAHDRLGDREDVGHQRPLVVLVEQDLTVNGDQEVADVGVLPPGTEYLVHLATGLLKHQHSLAEFSSLAY
jgi:hypothetical protein